MVPKQIMVIAGEASGDALAAALVTALRERLPECFEARPADLQPLHAGLQPRFFGAGGPHMAAAGVELLCDLTAHSVVGFVEVIRKYRTFSRIFYQLLRAARERQPHLVVCVDFGGFNLRFARAIKALARRDAALFGNWRPLVTQFVSPQVWASRPGRARHLEQNVDLLLSIFPFERDWYAKRAPRLRVEYVGHPGFDRHAATIPDWGATGALRHPDHPLVVLLPGSRTGELRRHVPVMADAARLLASQSRVRLVLVAGNESLARLAKEHLGAGGNIQMRVGGLPEALREADLAIACTGTVTVECALYGVPTVTLYKTSELTYQVGRRIVQVSTLTMPNLLAGQTVYPEFIQQAATPQAIAASALALLQDSEQRRKTRDHLCRIVRSLGGPGATRRAADAVVELLRERSAA